MWNKGKYNRGNNIAIFFSKLEIDAVKWKNRIPNCNLL